MTDRPLGLGTDLVYVPRFAESLGRPGFAERCFTPLELEQRAGPDRDARLAACFAAKEAVMKALGTGWSQEVAYATIEVRSAPSGAPSLHLSGGSRQRAQALGVEGWLVSLSHDGDYALASVLALGATPQCAPSGS